MPELALHMLRSEHRALLGWSLSTIALAGSVLAFWPSISGDPGIADAFSDLPPSVQTATGLSDITSPAGYLQGQMFSTLAPLIMLSLGIGRGARAIAGEEERSTMDLLLATPIRRSRVVVEKAVAILVELFGLGLVMLLAMLVINPLVDIDIGAGDLAAATAGVVALGAFYAGLALLLSAATGHRGISLGVAAGLAGAGFLYTSIAPFVPGLDNLLGLSPFDHAYGEEPIRNGFDWGGLGLLMGGAVVLVAAAVFAFDRRDVRT